MDQTVLRDPLSYATLSLKSLEGSHMTVSTVYLDGYDDVFNPVCMIMFCSVYESHDQVLYL